MNEIFHYQEIGAEWLTRRTRAILGDEMGLGKSAQAILAADHIHAQRILVLCRAVGRLNWLQEFATFSKRDPSCFPRAILSGTERPPTDFGLICSYDLMTNKEVFTWIQSQPWDLIILDEVHYLKNRKTARTQNIFGPLTKSARYVWSLSGTLTPNGCAGELYNVMQDAGVVSTDYWTFVRRYCYLRETPFETIVSGVRRAEELRSLLAPILLRRRKKDVIADLPDILFTDQIIEAGPVDMQRWYPELENHMRTPERFAQIIAEQKAALDAVTNVTGFGKDGMTALGALQAQCAVSRKHTGLQKVKAVVDLVTEEIESGAYDKIVLFAVHQSVVEDLWERFRKFKAVFLYGGTPAQKRDTRVRRFQNDPDCQVFIGNIQAAGTSISLTAANQVGFVESSWTPGDNAQAALRVHRIGQTQPVTVRFFNLSSGYDNKIQRVICRKTADIVKLFDRDASCGKTERPKDIDIFE